ncbi:MAG TPA: hypothetical protein VJB02_05255 [Coxiellaceae bacterium]|nr:hypothetical protein [Coxiellaceae bacterium]
MATKRLILRKNFDEWLRAVVLSPPSSTTATTASASSCLYELRLVIYHPTDAQLSVSINGKEPVDLQVRLHKETSITALEGHIAGGEVASELLRLLHSMGRSGRQIERALQTQPNVRMVCTRRAFPVSERTLLQTEVSPRVAASSYTPRPWLMTPSPATSPFIARRAPGIPLAPLIPLTPPADYILTQPSYVGKP